MAGCRSGRVAAMRASSTAGVCGLLKASASGSWDDVEALTDGISATGRRVVRTTYAPLSPKGQVPASDALPWCLPISETYLSHWRRTLDGL